MWRLRRRLRLARTWCFFTFTSEGRQAMRDRRAWMARIDDDMMRGDHE